MSKRDGLRRAPCWRSAHEARVAAVTAWCACSAPRRRIQAPCRARSPRACRRDRRTAARDLRQCGARGQTVAHRLCRPARSAGRTAASREQARRRTGRRPTRRRPRCPHDLAGAVVGDQREVAVLPLPGHLATPMSNSALSRSGERRRTRARDRPTVSQSIRSSRQIADCRSARPDRRPSTRSGALILEHEDRFSARRGPYRIIYELDETERVVRVVAIGHRRTIYRRR